MHRTFRMTFMWALILCLAMPIVTVSAESANAGSSKSQTTRLWGGDTEDRSTTATPTAAPTAAPYPTADPQSPLGLFVVGDTVGAANRWLRDNKYGLDQVSLAFFMRYGRVHNNDLNSDDVLDIPTLLERSVIWGDPLAQVNMALYEIDSQRYLKAYDILTGMSSGSMTRAAETFWLPYVWSPLKSGEGAFVCLLAEKYEGFECPDRQQMLLALQRESYNSYLYFIEKDPTDTPITPESGRAVIQDMQTILVEHGYLTNDVADGIYGNNTKAAVEAVQTAAGLPKNGATADVATLKYLIGHRMNGAWGDSLSFYTTDYSEIHGDLRMFVRNNSNQNVTQLYWEIAQCSESRSELGDLFGTRNSGGKIYWTTLTSTVNLSPNGLSFGDLHARPGTNYVVGDTGVKPVKIFDNTRYLKVTLKNYTTEDGEVHTVNKTIYAPVD